MRSTELLGVSRGATANSLPCPSAGEFSGNLGGPNQLSILSASGSGGYDSSSSRVISTAAKTFGMVLIPALVPLPLASGKRNASDPNAKLQYYIDCPTWSGGIADVFEKDGERVRRSRALQQPGRARCQLPVVMGGAGQQHSRHSRHPLSARFASKHAGWQAPVNYGLADITNLLNYPKLFPTYLRPRLPVIKVRAAALAVSFL